MGSQSEWFPLHDNPPEPAPVMQDIGAEMAALSKAMLQIAVLVALRTRQRGQREAEARVKDTQQRVQEERTRLLREHRDAKMRDGRNDRLREMITRRPTPGVSLEREWNRIRPDRVPERANRTPVRYDSAERRQAVATHLVRQGVPPELATVRMLAEISHATPPSAAVRTRPVEPPHVIRARQAELARVREREARGR